MHSPLSPSTPVSDAPAASEPVHVAVVGSANLDIVIELDASPEPGQTVLGTGYSEHGGGKGENQAIAAAKLTSTAFIGAVGTDAAGDLLAENMRSYGVDTRWIRRSELPSGRAFITLTPDAENSIAVIPGASTTLTADQVTRALEEAQPAVVVTQQEISSEAVAAAADWARANGRRFVINASPVRPVGADVLSGADPLIVNADEARDILAGTGQAEGADEVADGDPEHRLAELLLALSPSVIVTAGRRGAYLCARGGAVEHVPAEAVRARDTTGAGDEFAGTVAGCLALGQTLRQAAERASAASAALVQLPRDQR